MHEPEREPRASHAESGETRRPTRLLSSAPGERYAPAPAAAAPPVPAPPAVGRALVFGALGALAGAFVWGLASVLLGQELSLLVVGVVMGWLVGGAVAWGAWRRGPHAPDPRPGAMAAALTVLAFGLGLVASWLLGALTLPGSTQPLPERLAAVPLVESVTSQLGALQLLGLVLGAGVAWRSAR